MSLALLFVLLGMLFIIAEVFTTTFYFLPVGISFLITGFFATFLSPIFLIFIFLILSLFGLYLTKIVKQKITLSKHKKENDSKEEITLVGQNGVIVNENNQIKVKVFSDSWALLNEEINHYKAGDHVKISEVRGNKVRVEKTH